MVIRIVIIIVIAIGSLTIPRACGIDMEAMANAIGVGAALLNVSYAVLRPVLPDVRAAVGSAETVVLRRASEVRRR